MRRAKPCTESMVPTLSSVASHSFKTSAPLGRVAGSGLYVLESYLRFLSVSLASVSYLP